VTIAAAIAVRDGVLTRDPGAWVVVNAGIVHRICAMTVAAAAVIAPILPSRGPASTTNSP